MKEKTGNKRKLVIHPKDRTTDFLKVIYAGRDDMTVINGGVTKETVKKAIDAHDHIIMMGHGTPQGLLAVGQFNPKPKVQVEPPLLNQPVGKTLGKTASKTVAAVNKPTPKTAFGKDTGIRTYSNYGANYQRNLYEDDWHDYVNDMTTGYVIDDTNADQLRDKQLTTIWCNADQYIEWNELGGFYTGMFISEVGEANIIGIPKAEQWQVDESNYGFVSVVRRFLDQPPEVLHAALLAEYGKMAEYNPVARYNYRRLYVATRESNAEVDAEKVRPIA